jgi:hypothetical protein
MSLEFSLPTFTYGMGILLLSDFLGEGVEG